MSVPNGVVPSNEAVKLFLSIISKSYLEVFDTVSGQDLTKSWRRKQILKQIKGIVEESDKDLRAWVRVEIPAFYEMGMFDTTKQIYKDAGDVNFRLSFAHFHQEAVEALSTETYQSIASGMTGLTRTGERIIATATRDSILKQVS
jgi:hypothetical protein